MTALLLIAVALGIDNLAVSVAIGLSGVRGALRLRVALVFGLFEAGMPVLGMLAGHAVAGTLGGTARWTGGGLLVAVGCYQLITWYRSRGDAPASAADSLSGSWGTWRLLVSGLALSIDNLIVGFALGAYHVTLVTAAVVIALVSVAMSLAGLELGARLGAAVGEHGAVIGAIALAGVGLLMMAGVFLPGRLLAGEGRQVAVLVEVELAVLDAEHERFPLGLGEVELASLGFRRVEHHVKLALVRLVRGGGGIRGDDHFDPALTWVLVYVRTGRGVVGCHARRLPP